MTNLPSFSQNAGDYYKGLDCDYLDFVNDSIVAYNLDFGYWGTLRRYHKGLCRYFLKDSILILSITNDLSDSKLLVNNSNCPESPEIKPNDYQFKIINFPHKGICLIGPILKDYHRLNKKRFIRGFFTWPWKWSFKKQHWYDPLWRELKITGANSAYILLGVESLVSK